MSYVKAFGYSSYEVFWYEVFQEVSEAFDIPLDRLETLFALCNIREEYLHYLDNLTMPVKEDFIVNALSSFSAVSYGIISAISKLIDVDTCYDFGAGFGLSSLYFSKLHPKAKVFYYEKERAFTNVCKRLRDKWSVENICYEVPKESVDLVMAIEVLEHIHEPTQILMDLISMADKYIIFSSKATAKAPGHCETFILNGVEVPKHRFTSTVRKLIESNGFEQIKRGWNQSYFLYKRVSEDTNEFCDRIE